MHLNPAWREAEGRCREGRGGAARPRQPIRVGGGLPPLLRRPRAKIPNGPLAPTRRLPPPSLVSRNYKRKRSQRSPTTALSGPEHCGSRFSSTVARRPYLQTAGKFRACSWRVPACAGQVRRDSGRARCGRWR